MVLAKALQHCVEWSWAPTGTMCGTVQDLWRCLVPLIQQEEEDIWEASLFESVEEEPMSSMTPTEEALLLGEDLEPRGVHASALCKPVWPEEALKPEVTTGATDPLDMQ